jgi:transcriptional regulator with XRE-family HTH domain
MDNSLAERIKRARLRRRWTVAAAAREARIDRVTWTRIEAGERVQEVKLFAALDVLGIVPPLDDQQPGPRLRTGAEILRAARLARGWSLSDMAEALGVGPRVIADWEAGGDIPAKRLLLLRELLEPSRDVTSSESERDATGG